MNFEYMGLAEGVTKIDILEWWVKNEEKLQTGPQHTRKLCCASHPLLQQREFSVF